jgi:hypothetical protein
MRVQGDGFMRPCRVALLGVAVLAAATLLGASPAGGLTPEECEQLVEEGSQAREDLAGLIEAVTGNTGTTNTTTAEIGAYVADLIATAQINELGFVSADAGAPLEVCVPEGTTKLTMFSEPLVLWEGLATTASYPVSVVIPTSAACGQHTMQATGAGVDKSVAFEVKGACTSAGTEVLGVTLPRVLPRTGTELARLVAIGVALTLAGSAAVRGRRARRATTSIG